MQAVYDQKEQVEAVNSYNFTQKKKEVWKGLVPPRVEILAWFVLIGGINTKD